jgi:hypothetical protein
VEINGQIWSIHSSFVFGSLCWPSEASAAATAAEAGLASPQGVPVAELEQEARALYLLAPLVGYEHEHGFRRVTHESKVVQRAQGEPQELGLSVV